MKTNTKLEEQQDNILNIISNIIHWIIISGFYVKKIVAKGNWFVIIVMVATSLERMK